MNRTLRAALAALAVLFAASIGFAQSYILKGVSQLPDWDAGWNLQSQWDLIDGEPNIIRADQWRCPDGRPVTDVHWWGSYLYNVENPATQSFKFEISIFADDSNMPGSLLYREVFDLGAVNETLAGVDGNGENVFNYTAYLTDPFEQTAGEVYWLSIVALTEGTKRWPMWGWHTAVNTDIEELLQGSAQSTKDLVATDPTYGGNVENPWQDATYDMAFELTTIPEPSIVALAGLGLFALWTRFRRR